MRTNIVIDDSLKKKWWEIKQEAVRLHMKIGEYLIFFLKNRKKNEKKDKLLEVIKTPLSGGQKGIDAIEATKSMWKV